jgi:PAS domain-containing protein
MQHSTVQPREILPFAAAALIGLASVLLPGPETDWLVFAIGAALTLAIAVVGLTAAERQRGRPLILILPLAYFVAVVLLRHSGTTGATGFVPLVMLPIVWLALFGTRRQLIIGLVGMTLALVVPFLVFGDPRYPVTSWRSALLFLVVAGLTGLAIQSLVVRVRASHDLLSGVLRNATETAIVATDATGTITVFNRGAEIMLGYDAEEVVGKLSGEVLHDPEEVAARADELGVEAGPAVFVALGPEPQRARTTGASRCRCPSPPSSTTTDRSPASSGWPPT